MVENMAKKNGNAMTIGINRAQLKRHIEDVCSKAIEAEDEKCQICPFRTYVLAFLMEMKKA